MMLALRFDGTLALTHLPIPEIHSDQCLLKIRRAGICNTDLELTAGYRDFSGILGHEFVAEVVAGHPDWIGRRVVGEINVGDGTCDFCLRGMEKHCRNRVVVGIHGHQGAFAEYLALAVRNLHPVPDSVSDDQAVFVEPLAAALQITESLHISPTDAVIVIGAGKLGLLAAQVLRLTGANVRVVIRRDKQAELLNKWDIPAVYRDTLPPQTANVVIDCTGTPGGFADALDLVMPGGAIVLKSTYAGIPQADLTRVAVNEIRVIGSRCGSFAPALRLLAAGLVDVESLIEARYGLSEACEAMQHAAEKGALKILLDFPA